MLPCIHNKSTTHGKDTVWNHSKNEIRAPSWPRACLNLTSAYALTQQSWADIHVYHSFSLPDAPAEAAPSSPEESGNRILCFSSASDALAFLLLSSALPAVFQWVVPQTLSLFLAAKHCTRWLQAPGSSGWCNTKSQLEMKHCLKHSGNWGVGGRFRHLHGRWSLCSSVEIREKQSSLNGSVFWQNDMNFYFLNILILIFTEMPHWHFLSSYKDY